MFKLVKMTIMDNDDYDKVCKDVDDDDDDNVDDDVSQYCNY